MVDIQKTRTHLLALHKDMKQKGHDEYAEHILYILRTMLSP